MSVLLMTIATGERYRNYAIEMFESAYEFWPKASTLVFTDFPQHMQAFAPAIHTEPKGYPNETLFRYRTFLKAQHILEQWDHIFYVDADMRFVARVGDILSDGLVATLHPGYVGTVGTPEKNPISLAWCNKNTAYYCGGFQGGSTKEYLKAAHELAPRIESDYQNGVIAKWHDESHWNRYLADNPPSKVLGPAYCYPEDQLDHYRSIWYKAGLSGVTPILVALSKAGR